MTQPAPEPRIEDYALIGDCHTAALVGRDGSIDWLCLPRFDSPACFAALLGTPENGRWRIAPAGDIADTHRSYRGETLILETTFRTRAGAVKLIDFMPLGGPAPSIVRIVEGLEGEVEMAMELAIRFDYGRLVPWVTRGDGGALNAVAGPHRLTLRTPLTHRGEELKTLATFTVRSGQRIPLTVTYSTSFLGAEPGPDPEQALQATEEEWREWASRCNYEGPWREAVIRSLITLKSLTYAPTGGIVAAPTSSLPEARGGLRNWDYRFCWLRDATFLLLSLMQAGYAEEADAWRNWLIRAVAGHPSQLQPLYTVLGDPRLDEWEVPWLTGFGGQGPVRIGNAAFSQLQLDCFGEVIDALHHARRIGLGPLDAAWDLQCALLDHLTAMAGQPDRGIWEVRGPKQHFTHSQVMMWTAFDRGVAAVEHFGFDGPVEAWRAERERLREVICRDCFDEQMGAFVQSRQSKVLDAATLLIPLVGFLPADDPRMVGTVAAIERRLMTNGFVRRYDTLQTDDGLPPGEGVFLPCSFWFADNLVLQGRREEGEEIFSRLLRLCNDVGLMAEEYDVAGRAQLGNFPQALSHVALVGTAYNLFQSHGPATERPKRGKG
ncbi:MAG TPA: glycoside hydrolase family 15 protein [Hyphomicrobiales bacterium]|jgi:GH15 family glucan-1,4-alpha-glucosidase